MSVAFGRLWRVTASSMLKPEPAAGLDASYFETVEEILAIDELRITFRIEKTIEAKPNKCELTIYNLSEASRNALVRNVPISVRLEAGHRPSPSLMFFGDVRYGSNRRDGTEWVTELQLADGGRAYSQARSKPRSYAKGTPLLTILRDAARSLSADLPAEVTASEELRTQIATGRTLTGYAADEMTRLLEPYGYEWSFQDGRLQVLRFDQVRRGTIREISQETGMIGAPEIAAPPAAGAAKKTKKPRVPRLTVKHILYPEFVPGERFRLGSQSINGDYRAEKVEHVGDSHGDDWTTSIEGTELPEGK